MSTRYGFFAGFITRSIASSSDISAVVRPKSVRTASERRRARRRPTSLATATPGCRKTTIEFPPQTHRRTSAGVGNRHLRKRSRSEVLEADLLEEHRVDFLHEVDHRADHHRRFVRARRRRSSMRLEAMQHDSGDRVDHRREGARSESRSARSRSPSSPLRARRS
jgi:hypothetical protein